MVDVLKTIPKSLRTTMRKTATQLGISYTTARRMKQNELLPRHCFRLKPVLTDHNQLLRLLMCLDEVDGSTYKYYDM